MCEERLMLLMAGVKLTHEQQILDALSLFCIIQNTYIDQLLLSFAKSSKIIASNRT